MVHCHIDTSADMANRKITGAVQRRDGVLGRFEKLTTLHTEAGRTVAYR